MLTSLTGESLDKFGQVTPFLDLNNPHQPILYFGGASRRTWDGNAIMQTVISELPPGDD